MASELLTAWQQCRNQREAHALYVGKKNSFLERLFKVGEFGPALMQAFEDTKIPEYMDFSQATTILDEFDLQKGYNPSITYGADCFVDAEKFAQTHMQMMWQAVLLHTNPLRHATIFNPSTDIALFWDEWLKIREMSARTSHAIADHLSKRMKLLDAEIKIESNILDETQMDEWRKHAPAVVQILIERKFLKNLSSAFAISGNKPEIYTPAMAHAEIKEMERVFFLRDEMDREHGTNEKRTWIKLSEDDLYTFGETPFGFNLFKGEGAVDPQEFLTTQYSFWDKTRIAMSKVTCGAILTNRYKTLDETLKAGSGISRNDFLKGSRNSGEIISYGSENANQLHIT